jgi:hypothetical protein
MTADYPRLLVATEAPPNASGGGGAILRQMLKEWPVDRLFWWSCLPDNEPRFGQRVAAHRVAHIPWKLYPQRRWRAQRSWLLEKVWNPWAARHFRKTLSLFKPDAIWVIPISWSIPPMARTLLPSNIGFHVSVHDYPDCNNWVEQFGLDQTRRFTALSELLYSRATTRDAISRAMVEDLRARTGSDAVQVLRSGLEKKDFDYLQAKSAVPSDTIRIAYAGTITLQDDFACLVQALVALRPQLPRPVSLEIFSGHSYCDRAWFDPTWMHERGNLPEPQFSTAMRECTWGFALMALAENNPSQRFSFPTKFTSYLMAGLPIFSLGHPGSSLTEMVQHYRVGVSSSSGKQEILRPKVLEAFSLENPWKTFGPEILRCAREEFDAARRRQVLYDCFRTCAVKRGAS